MIKIVVVHCSQLIKKFNIVGIISGTMEGHLTLSHQGGDIPIIFENVISNDGTRLNFFKPEQMNKIFWIKQYSIVIPEKNTIFLVTTPSNCIQIFPQHTNVENSHVKSLQAIFELQTPTSQVSTYSTIMICVTQVTTVYCSKARESSLEYSFIISGWKIHPEQNYHETSITPEMIHIWVSHVSYEQIYPISALFPCFTIGACYAMDVKPMKSTMQYLALLQQYSLPTDVPLLRFAITNNPLRSVFISNGNDYFPRMDIEPFNHSKILISPSYFEKWKQFYTNAIYRVTNPIKSQLLCFQNYLHCRIIKTVQDGNKSLLLQVKVLSSITELDIESKSQLENQKEVFVYLRDPNILSSVNLGMVLPIGLVPGAEITCQGVKCKRSSDSNKVYFRVHSISCITIHSLTNS